MIKSTLRMMRRLGCLVALVILAAIALVGYNIWHGREPLALPKEVAPYVDGAKRASEELTPVARTAAEGARRAAEGVKKAAQEARKAAAALPTPEGGPVEAGVSVYFAPSAELNPLGIDDRFLTFLESAEKSILCAFYEIEWMPAADALVAKHKKGVNVEIVTDSDYQGRQAIQTCVSAGIPVVCDEREASMHDKFCVVDGRWVWAGSTNLTDNSFHLNDNNAVIVDSADLAANFAAEFDEMFTSHKFGARSPRNTPNPRIEVGTVQIECYFAPEDDVLAHVVGAVARATKSIDVLAFAFTSEPLAKAMAERARQGATVRAVFEARNAESRHSKDEFLSSRGVTVRMDKNASSMHDKVIIIDAETVITGSYDFTDSSEKENDDGVLILHSKGVAKRFEEEFERIFAP